MQSLSALPHPRIVLVEAGSGSGWDNDDGRLVDSLLVLPVCPAHAVPPSLGSKRRLNSMQACRLLS